MAPVAAAPLDLLERDELLAVLAAELEKAHAGGGRLVLVAGEAGPGKTALLRRFCERHEEARVLWGECDALFTPRPLGPLLEIAEETGGTLERAVRDGAGPHEVVSALLGVSPARPPIVVLEDVHRADEATLDDVQTRGQAAAAAADLGVLQDR